MFEGDEGLREQGDAATRRRRRIGALQDLSRARTNMDHATGADSPDPQTTIRLEEIEKELAELRGMAGSRPWKRNERLVLDLLLSERLLLDQLGFATYADYARSRDGDVGADTADLTDLAYLEFARLELETAQERLDAIEAGELDPAPAPPAALGSGELEPYLVVPVRDPETLTPSEPHGAPLEAWTAEPTPEADAMPDDGSPEQQAEGTDGTGLPHLGTTDLGDLDLPYWDETA